MLRVLLTPVLAATVVALTGTSARADILIDDFSLSNPTTRFGIGPGPNPLVISTPLGGGLSRTITLNVAAPVPAATDSLVGSVGEGDFKANFGFGASGTIQIAYNYASAVNFVPNVPAGGAVGDLVFSGSGDEGKAPNIPLTLTITTATGNLTFNGTLPTDSSSNLTNIPLTSLSGTGDLSQVTGVTIDITAGDAADLIIDTLGVTTPDVPAVPAPPAVLLALAAVPALGLLRAARRKA